MYHSSGLPPSTATAATATRSPSTCAGSSPASSGPCSTGCRRPASRCSTAASSARCRPTQYAELCLDVTRTSPGSLAVAPVIRIEEASTRLRPLAFIGGEGHGLVYVDPGEADRGPDYTAWRFGLARLARAVPPAIQRMALAGQRLEIPAAELPRFRDDFYPRLRHTASVISSDGGLHPARDLRPDPGPVRPLRRRPRGRRSAGPGPIRSARPSTAPRWCPTRPPPTATWTPSGCC